METKNNSQKIVGVSLVVVAIVAVLSVPIFLGKKSGDTAVADQNSQIPTATVPKTPKTPSTPVTQTPPVDTPKKSSSVYKDGTYTATGSYDSPGGTDQVTVTLTLKNDVVTDVSVTPIAGDGFSKRYQAMFISGYKQYVVGQKIAGLQLAKVSGSSLTSGGFNDALAQIKAQAKA